MAYKNKMNPWGTTIICGVVAVGLLASTGWSNANGKNYREQLDEMKVQATALEEEKLRVEEQVAMLETQSKELEAQTQTLENQIDGLKAQGIDVKEMTEEEQRYAYLTFDDGPSRNTAPILDFLKANNIKATFFVIKTEGYDEIYQRIVDEGHTLALHTDTHRYNEIYQSVDTYFDDLNSIAAHVKEITGEEPKIIRFPGGSSNTVSRRYGGATIMDDIIEAVAEQGYIYYDWNVDSGDAVGGVASPETIARNVIDGTQRLKEANILMHDAPGKKTTAQALPQIVEELKAQGFVFKAITEDTNQIAF